ncbi:putative transcription factor interactor and regulator CCHC(Zn) family [Helianthus annuus]|nr:putative transcription factor interactor and regulator CCHC(Zn) family [Helianthus annuus]
MKLQYGGNLMNNPTLISGQSSSQTPTTAHQKSNSNRNNGNQHGGSQSSKTTPPQNQQQSRPLCNTCGRPHDGVCLKLTGGCFRCKQPGHLSRNCPHPPKYTGKNTDTHATGANTVPCTTGGRVFALTADNKPTELAKKHHGYDVIGQEP